MIKSLKLQNFTVFKSADFTFSPGINVIIGENGSGKSHLLKLLYAVTHAARNARTNPMEKEELGKFYWNCHSKVLGVFKPDDIKNLQRKPRSGECKAEIDFGKGHVELDIFTKPFPMMAYDHPDEIQAQPPIFLPAKEILSMFPGFIPLVKLRHISIDETYSDLAFLLGLPLLREEHLNGVRPLIETMEKFLGGKVILDNDRFYIDQGKKGRLEINLLAEGLRKLAALVQLLGNGSIRRDVILFWDEPEANLNPALQVVVANVMIELAKLGVQVFAATHSLFLLKELDLHLEQAPRIPHAFWSLALKKNEALVERGDNLADLKTITSLDEALSQDDRERAEFWKKHA